jgi:hypothetical protein
MKRSGYITISSSMTYEMSWLPVSLLHLPRTKALFHLMLIPTVLGSSLPSSRHLDFDLPPFILHWFLHE